MALINSLVRPEANEFDLQRFWEHSLCCAVVADRLCEGVSITLKEEVHFNDYWMAALLHDCGKVVLGFFFWEVFERIVRMMDSDGCSFYKAETEIIGEAMSHDVIGEMLLRKSGMPKELVEAVSLHHMVGDEPAPLVAVIHLANNISKEIGLAYAEGEPATYDPHALKALSLSKDGLAEFVEQWREEIQAEVVELAKQCMAG